MAVVLTSGITVLAFTSPSQSLETGSLQKQQIVIQVKVTLPMSYV